MTTVKNDYSLLRPFDLEAAKAGEPICWFDNAEHVKFMLCSGDDGEHCVRMEDGNLALACFCDIRMSPLAWVEGKPVYRGDVLYWNRPGYYKFIVKKVTEAYIYGESTVYDNEKSTEMLAGSLTWNPPKVKREGWVNVSKVGDASAWVPEINGRMSHSYTSKQDADKYALPNRVACIKVEWEEEAK